MKDHDNMPMQNGTADTDHPTVDDLERYHAGSLEGNARLFIETHLAACGACTGQVAFFQAMATAARADRRNDIGPCPTEEALLGFLEEALPMARRDSIAAHVDRCDSCANRIADLAQIVHRAAREREETPATAFSASRLSTSELIRRVREMERTGADKPVGWASPSVTPRSRPGFAWNMRIAWAGIALAVLAVASILVYNRSMPKNIARQSPPAVAPRRVVPVPRPTEHEAANISPKHALGKPPAAMRIANRPKRIHRHGRRLPESPSDVDIEKIRVQPSGADLEKEGLPMPHGPQRHDGAGD